MGKLAVQYSASTLRGRPAIATVVEPWASGTELGSARRMGRATAVGWHLDQASLSRPSKEVLHGRARETIRTGRWLYRGCSAGGGCGIPFLVGPTRPPSLDARISPGCYAGRVGDHETRDLAGGPPAGSGRGRKPRVQALRNAREHGAPSRQRRFARGSETQAAASRMTRQGAAIVAGKSCFFDEQRELPYEWCVQAMWRTAANSRRHPNTVWPTLRALQPRQSCDHGATRRKLARPCRCIRVAVSVLLP